MPVPRPGRRDDGLAARLSEVVRSAPDRAAVICPSPRGGPARSVSFAELDHESELLARGLLGREIGPGTRVVLLVTPGPEFLALTFALYKIGAVPVVVDPGLGVRRLGECLNRAAPEAFIGIPRAHLARRSLGWGRRTVRTSVVVGGGRLLADLTLDQLRSAGRGDTRLPEPDPEGPAMVGFTSGSTGPPKGVVYRRDQLEGQLDAVTQIFGWGAGDVDLPTMPLFALFGTAAGVTAVLPSMDYSRPAKADPAMLARVVAEHEVTTMFGSPALLETLSRHAIAHGTRLTSLRRVVSAGAPVPASLLRRCHQMLSSNAVLCTPYGATEALPATTIESGEILGETAAATDRGDGVCVGRPVPGAELEIIPVTDGPANLEEAGPLPDGEIGEIVIRAPWVSAEYLADPGENTRAKIQCADGTFFHRIGDVGYRDGKGRIWFCGRVTQRVVTGDPPVTMFTVPCESVFTTHPAVFRSALTGPEIGGRVRPVMCVELESGLRPSEALRTELLELAAKHEHTRIIRDVLFHRGFPVDVRHNAKIGREALAGWARRRLGGGKESPSERRVDPAMSTFDYDGHEIHYLRSGNGAPIVFLHNGGSSHRIWKAQIDHFSATREVFALDLPGFGRSAKPRVDYTLGFYVGLLDRFTEELGLDDATLIGNCMGAATALTFAERRPERVRNVAAMNVLTRATITSGSSGPLVRMAVHSRIAARLLGRMPVPRFAGRWIVSTQFGDAERVDRETMEHLRERYRDPAQSRVLMSIAANMRSFEPLDHLDGLPADVPVLMIWGKHNRVLPAEAGERLAATLKPTRMAVIPGGHLAMLEHPEAVNDTIESFLALTATA